MSTSILYHGFGVVGYEYKSTEYIDGKMIFHIQSDPRNICCPLCGNHRLVLRGKTPRRFRSLPIGSKSVYLHLDIPRVFCSHCQVVRQVDVRFAESRVSYTKAFERYALELLRFMTIKDVSQHLHISWDVIKEIQKRYLTKHFSRPRLKDLEHLAIDEISVQKGHRYLTVVMDLDSGAVVFVGDGKGAEALDPFWIRLRRSAPKIKAVAIDMSPAYLFAVGAHLPDAQIVIDHFHVVKYFNDKLSAFRRDLFHELVDKAKKNVLKGTRWLLLKNPENLDEMNGEKKRLEEALKLNRPLATAYYLKEDLRTIWNQPNKMEAKRILQNWIAIAEKTGIRMLQDFAKTLSIHRNQILAFYDYPISTGPLEGMNNKIKTMKRQAYGFRDHEYFKLRILAIHTAKYALVG